MGRSLDDAVRVRRRPVRPAGSGVLVAPRPSLMARHRPARPSSRTEPETTAHAAAAESTATLRVLLVDDDAPLRSLYRFNLEASGMSVVEAADGETALELLQGALPDVVLLDVMMPGLDGWAVAARLAEDPRTARLPVIFITALADDEARARGAAGGAIGYLTKPFNPVRLADEIESLLAGAGRDDPRRR